MSIETDFQARPKEVAKAKSFFPASNATGFDISLTTETALTGAFNKFRHTVIDQVQSIATVSMTETASSRGPAVLISPSLQAGAAGFPVYFLPWDARGAAMELTIPNAAPGLPEDQHPRFFFTAVLSGCSIIFKGTAQNPTIFHCGTGGKTGGGAKTVGDSNQFFINLVRQVEAQGLGRTTATVPPVGGAAPSQVLSTDYMITKAGGGAAPAITQNTIQAMQAHYGNRMIVEDVTLWGMVFGVRTGTDWKFYLQKNGTIYYKALEAVLREVEVETPGRFGPFKYTKHGTKTITKFDYGGQKVVNRPIELTRVFPGTGNAKITNSWRSLV